MFEDTPKLEINVLIGKNPPKEASYATETVLETGEATPPALKEWVIFTQINIPYKKW